MIHSSLDAVSLNLVPSEPDVTFFQHCWMESWVHSHSLLDQVYGCGAR